MKREHSIRVIQTALLLTFMATIPANFYPIVTLFSTSDILAVILLLTIFVQIGLYSKIRIGRTALISIILMTIIVCSRFLPLLSGSTLGETMRHALSGVGVLVVFTGICMVARTKYQIRRGILALIVISVLLSFINILQGYGIFMLPDQFVRLPPIRQIISDVFWIENRVTAIIPLFATFGILNIIASCFLLVAIFRDFWIPRTFTFTLLLIVVFNNIAVLQSRSVWVGNFIALSIVLFFSSREYKKFYQYIKIIAATLATASPVLFWYGGKILVDIQPETVDYRIKQFNAAVELFISNPLTGVGRGVASKQLNHAVHNIFLETLAFSGILGAIAFILLTIILFRVYLAKSLSYSPKPEPIAILGALSGIYATALFYPASNSYVFWVFLALSISLIDAQTEPLT